MPTLNHILCYGRDARLLQTRRWVLERAGFKVHVTMEEWDFIRCLHTLNFDLLVLCHSLLPEQRDRALAVAEPLRPHLNVLLLDAGNNAFSTDPRDRVLAALDGPRVLVSTVENILDPQPAA